jgi:response regulator RpfG family c-di-GMP phosphodiesterase
MGDCDLKEIKQEEDLKRIPVVVLTISTAEKDILKAYDLHANCYINKPVGLCGIGMKRKSEWETFFNGHAPKYMDEVFTKNTAEEVPLEKLARNMRFYQSIVEKIRGRKFIDNLDSIAWFVYS